LGTKGVAMQVSKNDMDCKNCHLQGGTKPFAMPLVTVVARYPQFRAREARILAIQDRINNCIINPLAGKAINVQTKEMYAITMYLKWLWDCNKNVMQIQGDIPNTIPWMDKAASVEKGKQEYEKYCTRCHQANGEGVPNPTDGGYVYPPVWGMKSYALGSSMHRIGKLAAFLKYNMPNDKDVTKIQLTDEEAYNIAAYVNYEKINPRPPYNPLDSFYPESKYKAIDFPLGPYADPFSEEQHRWGPFKPIEEWKKKNK
jgi:thiosulfate dehydrogenase